MKKEEKQGPLPSQPVAESELKDHIHALLFAAAKKVSEDELVQLLGNSPKKIQGALVDLKADFDKSEGPVMLLQEGNTWKLTVKEKYLPVVQRIVAETELTKSVMETLAVIAFKHPILQADLIKIRTNKAYDHLRELEEAGYIARERFGRTRKIKLTQKFFEYFDLPADKVRDAFASFEAVEDLIKQKETEAQEVRKKMEDQKAKEKEEQDKEREEIDKLGNLDVFELPPEPEVEEKPEDKLGDLEVVETEAEPETEAAPEVEEVEEKRGEGVALTAEAEEAVDKRVDELLHPEKEAETTEGVSTEHLEGEEPAPEEAPAEETEELVVPEPYVAEPKEPKEEPEEEPAPKEQPEEMAEEKPEGE